MCKSLTLSLLQAGSLAESEIFFSNPKVRFPSWSASSSPSPAIKSRPYTVSHLYQR